MHLFSDVVSALRLMDAFGVAPAVVIVEEYDLRKAGD